MRAALPLVALLAGCGGPPMIDGQGAYTCVRVEGLTATTTTIYVSAAQGGTIVVQPDCSAMLQLQGRGVAL